LWNNHAQFQMMRNCFYGKELDISCRWCVLAKMFCFCRECCFQSFTETNSAQKMCCECNVWAHFMIASVGEVLTTWNTYACLCHYKTSVWQGGILKSWNGAPVAIRQSYRFRWEAPDCKNVLYWPWYFPNGQWSMVYCFIWLSQQAKASKKPSHAVSQPLANIRANENTMAQ